MTAGFEATVILYALGVAGACAWAAARDRPRGPVVMLALIVVQLSVLVQAVLDIGRLATGTRSSEVATHLGYLATSCIILPLAAGSVRMDERRWGSAALAVGCGVVAVVSVRLHQTLGLVRA